MDIMFSLLILTSHTGRGALTPSSGIRAGYSRISNKYVFSVISECNGVSVGETARHPSVVRGIDSWTIGCHFKSKANRFSA